MIAAIREDLDERDPDAWHWLQDLYVDSASTSSANGSSTEELFAVTVSGGRLYRWPIVIDGTTVTIGEPMDGERTALQATRQRQETADFRAQYTVRVGIEGTISQAVYALCLRRTRYRGLAKT